MVLKRGYQKIELICNYLLCRHNRPVCMGVVSGTGMILPEISKWIHWNNVYEIRLAKVKTNRGHKIYKNDCRLYYKWLKYLQMTVIKQRENIWIHSAGWLRSLLRKQLQCKIKTLNICLLTMHKHTINNKKLKLTLFPKDKPSP